MKHQCCIVRGNRDTLGLFGLRKRCILIDPGELCLQRLNSGHEISALQLLGALLSLMEPVMIVVLGVIVGGMVVAMYLPIFDMMNAVQ